MWWFCGFQKMYHGFDLTLTVLTSVSDHLSANRDDFCTCFLQNTSFTQNKTALCACLGVTMCALAPTPCLGSVVMSCCEQTV